MFSYTDTLQKIVDGDPKKLIGRAVDEDGDIIDKYGVSTTQVPPRSKC